jgi:hypothetical protein
MSSFLAIISLKVAGLRVFWGYRVAGYRVTGYRVTGYRVTGYRLQVTGLQVTGYRLQGYRLQGYRLQVTGLQVRLGFRLVKIKACSTCRFICLFPASGFLGRKLTGNFNKVANFQLGHLGNCFRNSFLNPFRIGKGF